ncbi:hypothetical protein [Zoogloea sp.]|uniref:hypothetical protein n=1 Tax=Zoogloea sp. TaxID=49181 RepID=UPI002618E1E7|nr:hypothetical protein [Zoogloea sp.]
MGRAPKDGLVITPRVCGICGTAHLYTAALALERLARLPVHAPRHPGAQPVPDGRKRAVRPAPELPVLHARLRARPLRRPAALCRHRSRLRAAEGPRRARHPRRLAQGGRAGGHIRRPVAPLLLHAARRDHPRRHGPRADRLPGHRRPGHPLLRRRSDRRQPRQLARP